MWLLMVEAIFALCLLVFIVWWTMFSGRPTQERQVLPPPAESTDQPGKRDA